MISKIRHEAYKILDAEDNSHLISRAFNIFLIVLIVLNTLAVTLETVDSIYEPYKNLFYAFEVFSVAVFSIEYLLRVWAITVSHKYAHPVWGRVKFLLSPGALIDLLAILPFYLPMIIGFDLRFIRILRLFRLVRILKISRYMHATKMVSNVLKSKKEELGITLMFIFFLIVVVSSIMYHVEHDAQPDKFSSIPATMYWSVTTLTTVGYGDVCPITPLGKVMASFVALLGIGMIALPAGILASGFSEELKKHRGHKKICPHCGKEIDG